MKRITILLICIFAIIHVNAYNITGRVIDEKNKTSLQGALVGISTNISDSIIDQVTTNSEGKFVFKNIAVR